LFQFNGLDGASPGAFGEPLEVFGDDIGRGVVGRAQSIAAGLFRVGDNRALPFDPVEDHRREDSVPLVIEHLRGGRVEQQGFAAVGEDVRAAAERVAKGGAAASNDAISGHDAEVQSGGHFEEHFELVDLRVILGGGDVEFKDAIDGLFAGRFADAEMGWLAAGRPNAARLDREAVQSALGWPRVAQPTGRERGFHATWKEQVAQWAPDAEPIEVFLLGFSTAIPQFGGRLADFGRGDRSGWKGAIEHLFGRAVVTVDMRRRE